MIVTTTYKNNSFYMVMNNICLNGASTRTIIIIIIITATITITAATNMTTSNVTAIITITAATTAIITMR